jgi:hypothetical protein
VHQFLNPLDLALCCVDRAIRGMGYPGFETQMLLWLSGRAEVARLRRAIESFGRRHPVITSRLRERIGDDVGGAYWNYEPGSTANLTEIELDSLDPARVLARAGELLSVQQDPATSPPLQFYLLHRPGGGDVFLMQYNHTLMDNIASALVVCEIDRLSQLDASADGQQRQQPRRIMRQYLRRFSPGARRSAAAGALELNGRALRGRAAILGTGAEASSLIYTPAEQAARRRRVQLRIAARALDPEATRAIHRDAVKLCGLPNLSMAILASVFRAIGQLGPEERNGQRNYVAGIGLDLNLRKGNDPLFGNLLSIMPISARHRDLASRAELVQLLSRQFRSRLEEKIDLGMVRLATGFSRRVRHMRWALEHVLRYSYSLWYAYFGALDSVGPQFCGVPVENAQYIGPAWSPMGIGLLVNQFGGQLCFQLTYDPYLVSNSLASEFLDVVVTDLSRLAAN